MLNSKTYSNNYNKYPFIVSLDIRMENFDFIFSNYIDSLNQKMVNAVVNTEELKERYHILYRSQKVTFFKCKNEKRIVVIDIHKASLEEVACNIYRTSV